MVIRYYIEYFYRVGSTKVECIGRFESWEAFERFKNQQWLSHNQIVSNPCEVT